MARCTAHAGKPRATQGPASHSLGSLNVSAWVGGSLRETA